MTVVTPKRGGLAVVAGGGGQLGGAVARRLRARGLPVVVLDRRPADHADGISSIVVDLTNEREVEDTIRQIESTDEITVLVNAQGVSPKGPNGLPMPPETMAVEQFMDTIQLNLSSCFLTMREVVPGMAARGRGRVVNVSSAAAHTGRTTASFAYSAAKAGVEALTRCFAHQYSAHGVLVMCVAPGKFENRSWITDSDHVQRYQDEIPTGRLATADEIAASIVFLASEDNTYITGATLIIDGGRLA